MESDLNGTSHISSKTTTSLIPNIPTCFVLELKNKQALDKLVRILETNAEDNEVRTLYLKVTEAQNKLSDVRQKLLIVEFLAVRKFLTDDQKALLPGVVRKQLKELKTIVLKKKWMKK